MRRLWAWLRADRPRALAAALALAALLAGGTWFFTARSGQGRTARLTADAFYYHAWLVSLVHDRDVDFTDEYAEFGNFYCFKDTSPGRPGNPFGVGPAIYELPFFLGGGLIAWIGGSGADGFSQPEVEATLLASLLFSLASMFFAWRVIRRRLAAPYLAIAGPLLALCGGPVIYYAVRQPGYAHPFATFWAAWLIDAWDASFTGGVRSRRTWIVLGALLGAAVLARPQLAMWGVLLPIAAADDVRIAWRQVAAGPRAAGAPHQALVVARRLAPAYGLALLAALVALLPQMLVWQALYGHLWLVPQGPGFMRWDAPAWSETLFSSRNGLLAWSPVYAVALLGLLAALRRAPRLAGALLAGVLLQALANGAAWDWWAGGSFGGRRFDSCYLAFAVGLAAAAQLRPRDAWPRGARIAARAWTGLLLALSAWLALANLWLAGRTASHNARIDGGQSAPVVLDAELPRPLAAVARRASSAATWPARHLFAWRHDTEPGAYDYLVGYHFLEERYPGLNCRAKPPRQRLTLSSYPRRLSGLVRVDGGDMVMVAGRARMLLGFNRHGPLHLMLGGIALPPGQPEIEVTLRFNGAEIADARLDDTDAEIEGTANELERGLNELTIDAPPGTRMKWLELSGPPTALGDHEP
ncbi:MAG TPA: hypothetical protein VL172_22115 [Kofleriaceae bacterium]|nr:hypothetical protein [Kofleriaceae bacterium]